jgi:hypothetical protein
MFRFEQWTPFLNLLFPRPVVLRFKKSLRSVYSLCTWNTSSVVSHVPAPLSMAGPGTPARLLAAAEE